MLVEAAPPVSVTVVAAVQVLGLFIGCHIHGHSKHPTALQDYKKLCSVSVCRADIQFTLLPDWLACSIPSPACSTVLSTLASFFSQVLLC